MKYLRSLLGGAFCALSLAAGAAQAQSIGINFDEMPVGTTAYYQHSNGDKWTEVYRGKKRGRLVVERFNGHGKTSGRPEYKYWYDAQGRRIITQGYGSRSKPYRLKYDPYFCYYQLGKCTHKQRFSGTGYVHSGSADIWILETRKVKGGFSTRWYKKREPGEGNTFFTKLGKYNLRTIESWGSKNQYFIKLVKLK